MLTEKLIAIGCDDNASSSAILDKLKETAMFSYNIISATMASGLTSVLRSMKPDLIILCFRNNQHVLAGLTTFIEQPEIPVLCLTRRFECETLGWNKNHIVFTCQLEHIHHTAYLSSRINSIFLLKKEPSAAHPVNTFADSAIAAAESDQTRNLSRYVMELDKKVDVLLKVKERIGELYPRVDDHTRTELTSIVNSIKISANDHKLWDDFKLYFEQTNPDFLLLLTRKYPSLTSIDLKYCCYLKMNMSNDDIRNLLGINQESVRTHKYRLKKKMALARDQDLITYLRSVDENKFQRI
jgi:DNA-binding CsgD family transcriptional regulator